MTETAPAEAGNAPETETPTPQAEPAADESQLGDGGKRALEAERTARKEAERANAELKRQLDAAATEKMTDLERAKHDAAEAQKLADEQAALVNKLRIVARHGLSEEDVDLLPDNLDAAEKAAARMAASASAPVPDPTQGGMGGIGSKTKGEAFADFANNFFTR